MTSAVNLAQLSAAAVAEHGSARNEPEWLLARRNDAAERAIAQAWPDSRKDEFWRSTPFNERFQVDRDLITDGVDVALALLSDELDTPAASVRIIDGVVTDITVPVSAADAGLVISELSEAAHTHAELLQTHLGSLTTTNRDGTGAELDRTITVNDAAWNAGVFIHIPNDVELDVPILIHFHAVTAGAHLPRVLVVAGRHARAQIILEHSSEDVDALVDEVIEVIAQDGSALKFASLQRWGTGVQHLSLQKFAVHRDADVHHLAVNIGGTTVRILPEFDMVGAGGNVRPIGVYFADEGQWFDMQPYVRHIAPRASSDVLFKGALQGASRTVFRGNIFVGKDAVGTATDENNKSLILTEGARADATPFLEIECADITAGHGSATGQIDAKQLFYLEARGIPRDEALRLIVYGFFREVLQEIDLPGVEQRTLADITARIESSDLSRVAINDASLQDRDE
jgi:Fe-S cluster assembly protein SufD